MEINLLLENNLWGIVAISVIVVISTILLVLLFICFIRIKDKITGYGAIRAEKYKHRKKINRDIGDAWRN